MGGGASGKVKRSTGELEHRITGAQEHRSTGVQENRRTGAQENKSTGAQEHRSKGAQEHRRIGAQENRSTRFLMLSFIFSLQLGTLDVCPKYSTFLNFLTFIGTVCVRDVNDSVT